MPSGRFAANGAWLAVQVMAHNLARWTARIGLGERTVITKTLRRRVFALVGRITRSARRLTVASPPAHGLGKPSSRSRLGPAASHSVPGLTGQPATDPTSPTISRHPGRESPLLRILSPSRASQLPHRCLRGPVRRLKTVRRPPIYPKTPGHLPCSSLTHPLPLSSRRPSVSFGGFGFKHAPRSRQALLTG